MKSIFLIITTLISLNILNTQVSIERKALTSADNVAQSATINITQSTAAELERNFNAVTKQIGSSFTYPLSNGYFKLGLE